ncbi:MAG: hypothetical protein J6N76_08780 [Lachnospiraceae bacterium]|nr:hypothetical protein [Lachnospiraceae bacterium]
MANRDGVIQSRLDLLIRLQDTTTGLPIEERNVSFLMNEEEFRPIARGFGNYILINYGRENGLMQVYAYGYEPFKVYVDYESLDERLPTVDVFMIPSENKESGQEMLSLSGTLKGLSSLECIHPGRPISGVREFNPKKKEMIIYAPNRRMNMIHSYYGLLHSALGNYEPFEITEQIDSNKVRLREPLAEEFAANDPICRRIFGQIDEDGNYLIRVRDDGKRQTYIVRAVINGEAMYKSVDFREAKEVTF